MCDVSVIPSMISPLEESEVPPPSRAAEYAAPATPAFETVLESPGYTVPEESRFTWIPGFVPVSEAVLEEEGGYLLSLEEPPPLPVPTSATTPAVISVITEPVIPMMPPTIRGTSPVREVSDKRFGQRCLWWKRQRGPPHQQYVKMLRTSVRI